MNIKPISFGKITHIIDCSVINKRTLRTAPASIYTYDCLDRKDDMAEIKALPDSFYFKDEFIQKMEKKSTKEVFLDQQDRNDFFSIKDEYGDIIGIANTHIAEMPNGQNAIVLDLLQTDSTNYKYAGQSLLAGICLKMRDGIANCMLILHPEKSAVDFYTDKCGFNRVSENSEALILRRKKFNRFVRATEQKTHGIITRT